MGTAPSKPCDPYTSSCQCTKTCPDGYIGKGWATRALTVKYRDIYNLAGGGTRGAYQLSTEDCSLSKSCEGYPTRVAGYTNYCNSPYTLNGAFCVYNGT